MKNKNTRHLGRLVKRCNGMDYPPETKGIKGVFYLCVSENGKRIKVRLLDERGEPITELKAAQTAQWKMRAAFVTGDRLAALRAGMGEIQYLEEQKKAEEELANPPLKLEEAWNRWLAVSGVSCGSGNLGNYEWYWRGFMEFCQKSGGLNGNGLYLKDISRELAMARISQLVEQGLAGSTVNKHLQFLRSFFDVLKKDARMTENPFDGIKKRESVVNSRRVLTFEELKKLYENSSGELHLLILLGMSTALRLEDCCRLRWEAVDLKMGLIRHTPYKTAHSSGKRIAVKIENSLMRELLETQKTLPEETLKEYASYILPDMARTYLSGPKGRTAVVCRVKRLFTKCGIQTTKYIDIKTGEERLKYEAGKTRAVAIAGFHSLRHTWVTMQMERGTAPAVVMAVAGHSNLSMTSRYTHISEQAAMQAAGVIGDLDDDAAEPGIEELRARAIAAVNAMNREQLKTILSM